MATQLNIKDPVFIARARELARRKGQPVTATLRALLDTVWLADEAERTGRLAKMQAFTLALQAAVPDDVRQSTSRQVMDLLYDADEPDGLAH